MMTITFHQLLRMSPAHVQITLRFAICRVCVELRCGALVADRSDALPRQRINNGACLT